MQDIYNRAKNTIWILLDILVAVAIIAVAVSVPAIKSWADSMISIRTVNVSAEGKATVEPDIATISFSVVSEGSNPEKLETDNNEKMTKAIDKVKKEGIEAKDIKTTQYQLSPRYEYNETTRKTYISGYTLTQSVQVKIRDLKKVATILGGLPGVGINQIGQVEFSVEDPDKYLDNARNEAFAKAHAKAQAMAKATGVELGDVVNFSEYRGGYPGPIYYGEAMGKGGDVQTSYTAPSIEPGSQEITVNVNITYEVED
ncbi:MAG: hypothetical protein A3F24_01075 [Candidatus Colwellbacteria bacterium RIFCSPHIGHO2_12_FULL_44_17]|uniref:SIMPL domain-containing protein n=2 Tax=Candidatus Colwelliibacteriota TaxID=1817904 RepID=A0A1G1ZAJ6_9BACT|nr:MAG: hypothetical protein A3F24_01075 [Candidatus Colwellbacteria bacterium RIFCSPHIGHO2_12_FULL_44_17]OGY60890.1 MAG: hypothetical protein A3I31_00815 [Candidatus Colwellbacteria bacterium RIFCSPLOWO2_02_FULL_44_20b]